MMTKSKKVVLWGHNEVLGEAMEDFLTTRNEWEIVKMLNQDSAQAFIDKMENDRPDVVIVYETEYANVSIFPYALLHTHPEIKVITVSLENNYLEVFDKHRVWINQVSDLYTAIDA